MCKLSMQGPYTQPLFETSSSDSLPAPPPSPPAACQVCISGALPAEVRVIVKLGAAHVLQAVVWGGCPLGFDCLCCWGRWAGRGCSRRYHPAPGKGSAAFTLAASASSKADAAPASLRRRVRRQWPSR